MKNFLYLTFFLFAIMATLSIKAPNISWVHSEAWIYIRGILAISTLILAILVLLNKIKIDK